MAVRQRDHDELGRWLVRNGSEIRDDDVLVLYVDDPGTTDSIHCMGRSVIVRKNYGSHQPGWYTHSALWVLGPKGNYQVADWMVSHREIYEEEQAMPIETIYDDEGNEVGWKFRQMTDEEKAAAGEVSDAPAEASASNDTPDTDADPTEPAADNKAPRIAPASGPGTTKRKTTRQTRAATR